MWAKRRMDDEFSVSKMSCSTSLILGERGREDWRGMAETWKLPMWKELRSITPLFWGSMSVFLVFIPMDLCQFLHDDMTNCPDRHDPVGRWGRFGEIWRLIQQPFGWVGTKDIHNPYDNVLWDPTCALSHGGEQIFYSEHWFNKNVPNNQVTFGWC